jgi:L-fuconolactonase
MRIDAHQHFWQYDSARDSWVTDEMAALRRDFGPADLEPELASAGIDGCIAVQADQSLHETQFLLDIAERHPFVRGVVGWVDLRADPLSRELERVAGEERLCGLRHIAQAEADDFLIQPDVVRGIAQMEAFGLTYDILIYPRQLPAALALVERLPGQRFVIDHMAKPEIRTGSLEPWASGIRAIAEHPDVWCKVSGLVTEADWRDWRPEQMRPYLDTVFDAFGPDRLMFGSDWPVCLLAARYTEVLKLVEEYAASLSRDQRDSLFGLNALRFYGLNT